MNLIFTIILSNGTWDIISVISTICLGLIAFGDEIANSNPSYLFALKNVVVKVIVVVFFAVIIMLSNQGKEENAEIKSTEDGRIARHERDSINGRNIHLIDSMSHNQIDSANIGLRDVGIRIDTSAKGFGRLIKLVRDSARKQTVINSIPSPIFFVDSIYMKPGIKPELIVKSFFSKGSAKDGEYRMFAIRRLEYNYIGTGGFMPVRFKSIPSEFVMTYSTNITLTNTLLPNPEDLAIYFSGKYKDDKDNNYDINEVYKLAKSGRPNIPTGPERDFIINEFKRLYPQSYNKFK